MGSDAHMDFDAVDLDDIEPAGTFTLAGRTWSVLPPDHVPYAVLRKMDAARAAVAEGDSAKAESLLPLGDFFGALLLPDDVPHFLELLESPPPGFTIGKFQKLMGFVSQIALGGGERPTQPSRSSSPGRRSTGRTSEGASSSKGTTRRASAG